MNRAYKVVRCQTTGVFKAVSETAKSSGKTKSVVSSKVSVTRVLSPVKVLGAALVGLTAFAASIPAQADFGDDSRNMIYDLQGRVTVLENGSNQAINSVVVLLPQTIQNRLIKMLSKI